MIEYFSFNAGFNKWSANLFNLHANFFVFKYPSIRLNLWLFALLGTILLSTSSFQGKKNPLQDLKNVDLSDIWLNTSMNDLSAGYDAYMLAEPIGFIGSKKERLYIHISQVQKNPNNPQQYLVTGKTRVQDVVCPFTGQLTLTKAEVIYVTQDESMLNDQLLRLEIQISFQEEKSHPHTGTFTGQMQTYIYRNRQNIWVAGSFSAGDRFCLHQSKTIWKSYDEKLEEICHWGIYRIPDCGDLDQGKNKFMVNEKYLKNGWQIYHEAFQTNHANAEKWQQALNEFNRIWWE